MLFMSIGRTATVSFQVFSTLGLSIYDSFSYMNHVSRPRLNCAAFYYQNFFYNKYLQALCVMQCTGIE